MHYVTGILSFEISDELAVQVVCYTAVFSVVMQRSSPPVGRSVA